MQHEIFADIISAIHITDNLVRIDFATLQPHLKGENGQPVLSMNKRIIMPLAGFIQSLSIQDSVVKQLQEAGLLKSNVGSTETVGSD
jgi:hypothetical protein